MDVSESLRSVTEFVNTVDIAEGSDSLATPRAAQEWLRKNGWPGASLPTKGELGAAVQLRTALRVELIRHGHDEGSVDPSAPDLANLNEVLVRYPVAVEWHQGGPRPIATKDGLDGAVAEVVAGVLLSAHDGSWLRLKICPADDCAWAFFDGSRNGSKRWCSMRTCGNRHKTREYRERTKR